MAGVLLLAAPLIAISLWLRYSGAWYPHAWFRWDVLTTVALSGLLVLAARWRVVGRSSWPLAWVVYVLALGITLGEATSFYFQASSFNARFFANLRLANLRSGIDAFPFLFAICALVLVFALAIAAWCLRVSSVRNGAQSSRPAVVASLTVLTICVCALPSPWQRLARFFASYRQASALASSAEGLEPERMIHPDLLPRDQVRATPGRNLVIIYMESLERIYTDERIFPGLTPRLNEWRTRGLDFSGYLTYAGANYTMAGLFASQCGAPYFTSPLQVFDFTGNDANDTTFQPGLTCLGDVLHAAGYRQVFMNGSPLSFADQGAFFRMHSFDEVLGLDELESANHGALRARGWGLYDSDLFRIAERRFDKLAASGKPFNLDLLTIDNHPPHGRPSPGCPKYAANSNDVLQAVHCTDSLVGEFLDAISRNPAWKNTVVVVMSDHESLRNDAWPLYPSSYKRRPLLFVLNAGQGERSMRFYHMDIAPTVLHLMGVATNAEFLAGADRSEADAPGSSLVDNPEDVAVLRHALWARTQPVTLCTEGVLVGAADDGLMIGGHEVPLSNHGDRLAGLAADQTWTLLIGPKDINGTVIGSAQLPAIETRREDERILLVRPDMGAPPVRRFSIEWIGRGGARAWLADVPRLENLQIESPDCAALIDEVDRAPRTAVLDLREHFTARTAPLYPALPATVDFTSVSARAFERELGWTLPAAWGTWSMGTVASLGFALPPAHCHGMPVRFAVRPYLTVSRPRLAVKVSSNGRVVGTWQFDGDASTRIVETSIVTPDPECRVDLRFEFARPDAALPPYPHGEDSRPLQLDFLRMSTDISASAQR